MTPGFDHRPGAEERKDDAGPGILGDEPGEPAGTGQNDEAQRNARPGACPDQAGHHHRHRGDDGGQREEQNELKQHPSRTTLPQSRAVALVCALHELPDEAGLLRQLTWRQEIAPDPLFGLVAESLGACWVSEDTSDRRAEAGQVVRIIDQQAA